MGFTQNRNLILLLTGLLLTAGCIKFEDPPNTAAYIYASPCTDQLIDNQVKNVSINDDLYPIQVYQSPEHTNDGYLYSSPDGSFQLILSSEINSNGAYPLSYFSPESGEAKIRIRLNSPTSNTVYTSDGGSVYLTKNIDGTGVIEWCDVPCISSLFSGTTIRSSGRLFID